MGKSTLNPEMESLFYTQMSLLGFTAMQSEHAWDCFTDNPISNVQPKYEVPLE